MSKFRRILFTLLSTAALVALFALFLGGHSNTMRQWRQLPDGSKIRILDAPYGRTNYTINNLKKSWRFLEFAMPESIARKLGILQGGVGFEGGLTNELCFVTDQDGIPSTAKWDYEWMVLGDHGERYGVQERVGTIGQQERMTLWAMPNFPRREKVVRVVLASRQTNGSWSNVAEFKIPNAVRGPFPVWKAESLPVTRTNGDLKVTLASLVTGLAAPEMTNSRVKDTILASRIRFRVEQPVEGTPWHFRALELADATGNILKSPGWQSNFLAVRRGLEEEVTFRGTLGLDEPAWKVRAEFARKSGFGADELVEISPIPVPAPGAGIKLNLSTNVQGTTLTVGAIRARNAQPAGFTFPPKQPHENLVFYLPENSVGIRITMVKAIDDQQREIRTGVDIDDGNWICMALDIPPDSKQLYLTFALSKSRFFEFLVKPTVEPPK